MCLCSQTHTLHGHMKVYIGKRLTRRSFFQLQSFTLNNHSQLCGYVNEKVSMLQGNKNLNGHSMWSILEGPRGEKEF